MTNSADMNETKHTEGGVVPLLPYDFWSDYVRAVEQLRAVEYQRDQLLASLKQALRYIEVRNAYQGAMTADQVEAAIKESRNVSQIEIGANSCNTLAVFDLEQARATIAACGGE